VRERDGHTLWSISLDVFSPDLNLAEVWMELPDQMRDRQLEDVVGWGMRDEPEGLYADAQLLVWATDVEQAQRSRTASSTRSSSRLRQRSARKPI
jgi:hypothetical protein